MPQSPEFKACVYHGRSDQSHPGVFILRHLCIDENEEKCDWFEIVYCCQACHDTIVKYLSNGNYYWDCERCGGNAKREFLGKA